jgi:hypothetical protein
MKKTIPYIMFICVVSYQVYATYYEITTNIYTPGLTLQTGDSLYMTDGGFGDLNLFGESSATIKGTSPLAEGTGGIWIIRLLNNSSLYMTSGQVNMIDIGNNATAVLKGGLIRHIYSYQWVPYTPGRDGVPNPNIKLYYSGDLPTLDSSNVLTGLWGNGDPFSIHLHDVPGYDPVIQNIQFILVPEPMTLTLFTLGTLLLRRKQN